MSKEEAISAHEARFGGYPSFLLMGASDPESIDALTECIRTGKELTAPDQDDDY